MHKTKNDLPEEVRARIAVLLQERPAEAQGTLRVAAKRSWLPEYPKDLWLVEAHAQ